MKVDMVDETLQVEECARNNEQIIISQSPGNEDTFWGW